MTTAQKKTIQTILAWYATNVRDLPWRHTSDPYHVLVSEIMLQQTQVSRVINKWYEFLSTFPTVQTLAAASTADVITAWKGLGYNRRALYLQKTAQAVVAEYKGMFPKDIDALKALPGIGDYTARAVLSFAFDKPVPMMDTNHRKLYMRLFFDSYVSDKELLNKAEEVIVFFLEDGVPSLNLPLKGGEIVGSSRSIVWHWNQALMDFMSAVARNDEDVAVQSFMHTYPDIPHPHKQKQKKTVPFKQTDRYIRGRIIDRLREENIVSKRALIAQFSEFPKERVRNNIQRLVDEGLIDIVKQSIILATNVHT